MKKWFVLFNLCFVVWSSFVHAGELERIQNKGVITVSLNREYPPFAMQKDGKLFGLDVDLAHLLAEYLGVKVRFIQPQNYDQQIPKLLAGESDIIVAAMTRTIERGLKINFADPYFEVSQAALVNRNLVSDGADSYFDLLEISSIRLGVKAGTTHEKFARELFDPGAIKPYPTATAAADALIKGEVDAMVADSPFVRVWRATHPEHYQKIAALLQPVTREYYAFAIRQGDQTFLNWLNLFVGEIKTDGTLDLLKYEYVEQMRWTRQKAIPQKTLTRAKFLKNRFVARKKAMIEERRKEFLGGGDHYE
jgi:polar amino acid transport system substrate-binding protein